MTGMCGAALPWRHCCVFLLLFSMLCSLISATQLSNKNCTYSFFFLAFRQPVAAKMAFLRVKSIYPDSPVYIYSDKGGIDLSGLCTDDPKCKFTESPVHNGHAFDSYKKRLRPEILERAKIFMTTFRDAAEWGQCEYMVYVEEDVWIEKPITANYVPVGDNGGIFNPWYPVFTWPLQEYIRVQTGQPMEVKTVIYGASYYRTDALIDAMDNHWDKIDWMKVNELDGRVPMCWDTIPPILFALSGYKVCQATYGYVRVCTCVWGGCYPITFQLFFHLTHVCIPCARTRFTTGVAPARRTVLTTASSLRSGAQMPL